MRRWLALQLSQNTKHSPDHEKEKLPFKMFRDDGIRVLHQAVALSSLIKANRAYCDSPEQVGLEQLVQLGSEH